MILVSPKAWLMTNQAAIKALLDTGELALFTNDITPDVNTVVGDLTEATFTGYARATLTAWLAPHLNVNLQSVLNSPLASFATAAPYTVGEQVYGGWIEDAAGNLAFAFRFDNAPIPMIGAGDAIVVAVESLLGNPMGQGFCTNG